MHFAKDIRSICLGGFKHSHRIYSRDDDERWSESASNAQLYKSYDQVFAPCVAKCTGDNCPSFSNMYKVNGTEKLHYD